MAAPKKIPQHSDLPISSTPRCARRRAIRRAANWTTAEDLYRQVLGAQPDNFDALHLCGVLMQQRGRSAEALEADWRGAHRQRAGGRGTCQLRAGAGGARPARRGTRELRARAGAQAGLRRGAQ